MGNKGIHVFSLICNFLCPSCVCVSSANGAGNILTVGFGFVVFWGFFLIFTLQTQHESIEFDTVVIPGMPNSAWFT